MLVAVGCTNLSDQVHQETNLAANCASVHLNRVAVQQNLLERQEGVCGQRQLTGEGRGVLWRGGEEYNLKLCVDKCVVAVHLLSVVDSATHMHVVMRLITAFKVQLVPEKS